MSMDSKVYLVGVGMGDMQTLTLAGKQAIESSDLIIGARRLLEPFMDLPAEKRALVRTAEIVDAVHASDAAVISVLLSGDTGFYSGATNLIAALGFDIANRDAIEIIPGISSLQYFCAKVGKNWDDACIASVHGRTCDVVSLVRRNAKVFLLTGGAVKVHDVCRLLVEAGLGAVTVYAGERLTYDDERIVCASASEVAELAFADLAVMLIERVDPMAAVDLAADDTGFVAIPRVLVGAPRSGSGKTSFVCGLLRVLQRRGLTPAARKCGPDYIDPMFHRTVLETPSSNIDLFFMDESQALESITREAGVSDVVVIEGAMGFYDGVSVSDQASAYDVARATATPVILVFDVHGQALSAAAEVLGFLSLRKPNNIVGVVLNRATASLHALVKPIIEAETGIAVLGYIPKLPEKALFESRHLGLVTAAELDDLHERIDLIADALEESVDVDAILALARDARALPRVQAFAGNSDGKSPNGISIGVARDAAFCFYYDDTLRLLERLGAHLVMFSPLADESLPQGISGLYLGGGYPELYARALSSNDSMRASVRAAIDAGMPVVAECGGFLYLHDELEDDQGTSWPMVGAIHRKAYRTPKLGRFGYVTLTAQQDGLLCEQGETLRAHEFHYWESEDPGNAFVAQKPQSTRSWECCVTGPSLYAGFPHVYLPSNPKAAQRFVDACARYANGIALAKDALGDTQDEA